MTQRHTSTLEAFVDSCLTHSDPECAAVLANNGTVEFLYAAYMPTVELQKKQLGREVSAMMLDWEENYSMRCAATTAYRLYHHLYDRIRAYQSIAPDIGIPPAFSTIDPN